MPLNGSLYKLHVVLDKKKILGSNFGLPLKDLKCCLKINMTSKITFLNIFHIGYTIIEHRIVFTHSNYRFNWGFNM